MTRKFSAVPPGLGASFGARFPALRAGLKSSASLRDFWGIYDPTRLFGNLRRPSGTRCEFWCAVPSTACWAKVFGVPTGLLGNLRRPYGDYSGVHAVPPGLGGSFAARFPALRAGLNSPASLRDFYNGMARISWRRLGLWWRWRGGGSRLGGIGRLRRRGATGGR